MLESGSNGGPDSWFEASSAGTANRNDRISLAVHQRLLAKGIDASGHRRRRLTLDVFEEATFPVAMGVNHQDFVLRHYGRWIPLFYEVCAGVRHPLLDVDEVFPNGSGNERRDYKIWMVDFMESAMPRFLTCAGEILQEEHLAA